MPPNRPPRDPASHAASPGAATPVHAATASFSPSGATERRRILLISIAVLVVVSLAATGAALVALYRASFEQQRARLTEVARGRARIIEAVARFDQRHTSYPQGSAAATMSQISEAHQNFAGFGETGEFTLARLEDDAIVFLLSHRHGLREAGRRPLDGRLLEQPVGGERLVRPDVAGDVDPQKRPGVDVAGRAAEQIAQYQHAVTGLHLVGQCQRAAHAVLGIHITSDRV